MFDFGSFMNQPEVLTLIGTVLLALIGVLIAFLRMIQRKLDAVGHQIVNDHGPDSAKPNNLRDQIDEIQKDQAKGFEQVKAELRRQDKQYGEMHRSFSQEVEDRQALERRISDELRRLWEHNCK